MNEKNYEFLEDQLKYTGFGPELQTTLKTKMEEGKQEFQLSHSKQYGNDVATSTLHFKRSDQGNYFFNRYEMELKQGHTDETLRQTFYIGKENNITHKEAFNLLSGRSVNKNLVNREGEAYSAWLKLDFKETDASGNYKQRHFHQNFGYQLEEVLSAFPIKELQDAEEKKRLMESLQKGNVQSVTFIRDGKEEKHFIEACPQYKSINVYSEHMERIRPGQQEKESAGQETNQSRKTVSGAEAGSEEEDTGDRKQKSRKSRKVS